MEQHGYFHLNRLWAFPFFAAVGGSFGYWMMNVDNAQLKLLADRRDRLLEKRKRRAEREEVARKADGNGLSTKAS